MIAHRFHLFGEFVLRPATPEDLPLAQRWTEEDPWHIGVSPEFWIEQMPRHDSYLLTDLYGPVFFFKIILVSGSDLELHIQFSTRDVSMSRIVAALIEGMQWLERKLSTTRVSGIYFESQSPTLIQFAKKRLGFTVAPEGRIQKILKG